MELRSIRLLSRSGAVAVVGILSLSLLFIPRASQGQAPVAPPAPPSRVGASVTQVPVTFSGGYETDPRDRGRPVVLIAAALGVPPEVFREAFRHVRPAAAGTRPDPEQVRQNKAALLNALGRYGITNERLDTVSNYYRYVRSRGELWPTRPASAYAVVSNGVIQRFVVTDGGSGYSSAPTITVPGITTNGATSPRVTLTFGKQFEHNGSVSAITLTSESGTTVK